MSAATTIVPFGKYKGAPVERLIADRDYCDWLASQPWFRERFPTINQFIISYGAEPQDTPEHNMFQVSFLQDETCLDLARLVAPRVFTAGKTHARGFSEHIQEALERGFLEHDHEPAEIGDRRFEDRGWDVVFDVIPMTCVFHVVGMPECVCVCVHTGCPENAKCRGGSQWCYHQHHEEERRDANRGHCGRDCYWHQRPGVIEVLTNVDQRVYEPNFVTFRLELKPLMGDDFPGVLRQVSRYETTDVRDVRCVVVRDAHFEGVSWEQVTEVFAASDIRLVRVNDIASVDET